MNPEPSNLFAANINEIVVLRLFSLLREFKNAWRSA
jgi:hypothetical protein